MMFYTIRMWFNQAILIFRIKSKQRMCQRIERVSMMFWWHFAIVLTCLRLLCYRQANTWRYIRVVVWSSDSRKQATSWNYSRDLEEHLSGPMMLRAGNEQQRLSFIASNLLFAIISPKHTEQATSQLSLNLSIV